MSIFDKESGVYGGDYTSALNASGLKFGSNNLMPANNGNLMGPTPLNGAGGDGWFSRSGIFGGKDGEGNQTNGWGGMALGVAQGLGGAYMGMKQYGMAQDSLKENKRQFQMNYNAQKKTLNTQLDDRQRARVASNPGAYESVDSYMKKNGI
jgi:hypothetical protein